MINFVEHKNIDKQKWDVCIEQSVNSCIYVYSWYLDVACENWSALVLNDYEAVFPLAPRSKYSIHYLYQPFFTRYFGVFSKTKPTMELVDSFFNTIPERFKFIEFSVHETTDLESISYSKIKRQYQQLNLNVPHEILYKDYSDNAKRSVKKAVKAGLIIKSNADPELVVKLFKSTKGEELGTFKAKDYKILLAIMNAAVKRKKAESFAVYNQENQLCAAGFFLKNNNRFVYLKGGVTDYGKSHGAMHFLFDSFIKQNSETDQVLDFGGSSVESVARFYKNFGAKDCVYLQLKKNSLSRVVKWISNKQ